MKKVICLLVVGEKYEKQFSKNKSQFYLYAQNCGAEIKIIDTPLDATHKRPLLSQKLLIPSLVKEFDIALFMDLDIKINKNAPSIFDVLPKEKSFGAITDPRGTEEYNKTWVNEKRITEESTLSYFETRNFSANANLKGSINGGVFVFRPLEVFDLFENYYYSDHDQGPFNSYEEGPMAYLTQSNDSFFNIDPKFNLQILYKLKGTKEGNEIINNQKKIPSIIRKYYQRKFKTVLLPTKSYKNFVEKHLQQNWFIHFAGGYPLV